VRSLTLIIICLSLPPLARAEYSRAYLDSYPLEKAQVGELTIAYRIVEPAVDKPKAVVIMGLGGSNVAWGDALISGLTSGGYEILILDNRDTGASTRFDSWGQPLLWWQLLKYRLGFSVNAPYTLNDMAADITGLMQEIGYEEAHIVGASMGGMIAQIVAARYPERTRSLISIMSTTNAPHLPPPTAEAEMDLRNLATGDAQEERERSIRERGFYPESMQRHLMAIFKTGDRSSEVASIKAPTLVLHGADDGLVPPQHGRHTASLIQDSRFLLIEGMAHNMPDEVIPLLVSEMTAHMNTVEAAGLSIQ
jgi:pimeloyl-ACP methyl ester carboxylesterase|tara:strand:- start:579 stop:1502 length:924 start_codon:yes stop_codon:yes gene_type:complete